VENEDEDERRFECLRLVFIPLLSWRLLLLLLLLGAVMTHQGAATTGAALQIRMQFSKAMALQAK